MKVAPALAARIFSRAGGRCEYCKMSQSLQGASFHVEHIVPRSKGGASTEDNLALACPGCNLLKSDRTEAMDPDTGMQSRLFHPRSEGWEAHFAWSSTTLLGLTPVGRATIEAFQLNHPRRLRIREAEAGFSLFPP